MPEEKYEPEVWRFFYGMRSTVDGGDVGRMQVMSKIIILASKRNKIMTEYEKMLSGEIYNAADSSLLNDLYACSELCWEYNQIRQELAFEKGKFGFPLFRVPAGRDGPLGTFLFARNFFLFGKGYSPGYGKRDGQSIFPFFLVSFQYSKLQTIVYTY